jgi:hypothetical protein
VFGGRLCWEDSSLEDKCLTKRGIIEEGGKMVKVDNLKFGSIVVGGKEYQRDIFIFPDGSVKERKGGFGMFGDHAITKAEIEKLVEANPDTIVVGTGTSDAAGLVSEAKAYAQQSKAELLSLSSFEAIERFNKLVDEGKRVAALIHITC